MEAPRIPTLTAPSVPTPLPLNLSVLLPDDCLASLRSVRVCVCVRVRVCFSLLAC